MNINQSHSTANEATCGPALICCERLSYLWPGADLLRAALLLSPLGALGASRRLSLFLAQLLQVLLFLLFAQLFLLASLALLQQQNVLSVSETRVLDVAKSRTAGNRSKTIRGQTVTLIYVNYQTKLTAVTVCPATLATHKEHIPLGRSVNTHLFELVLLLFAHELAHLAPVVLGRLLTRHRRRALLLPHRLKRARSLTARGGGNGTALLLCRLLLLLLLLLLTLLLMLLLW